MEQQYQYYPENARPVKKPENSFLRIWGPLLIKWGIGLGVSMIAVILFEGAILLREAGIDPGSPQMMAKIQLLLQKYMTDKDSMNELVYQINEAVLKYTTPIEGISAFITIPVLWIMFHKDRVKEKISGYIPNEKAALWKYIGVVVLSLSLTLGLNNLITISGISAYDSAYEETMNSLYSASLPVQVICLGILIPICEEMVFRGLMFRRLRQSGVFLVSAAYSSIVFALLHVNMVQMLYAFAQGFVFCWLYEKYGSVKAPILAHITSNLLAVILTYTNAMAWLAEERVRIGTVTVLCATVASSAYVLIQRIEEKPGMAGDAKDSGQETSGDKNMEN